jgi:hypothetical protein
MLRKEWPRRKLFVFTLFLTLCTAVLAGTPGDTTTNTITVCSSGTCTQITIYYMLDSNHKWIVVGYKQVTFPDPNYTQEN